MVTVINDAAENSGLLSNNSCAQGAFEGRGPVAKETDEIQNGPRATVLFSSFFFLSYWPPNGFLSLSVSLSVSVSISLFLSLSLKVFSRCFGSSCRAVLESFLPGVSEGVCVRSDFYKIVSDIS